MANAPFVPGWDASSTTARLWSHLPDGRVQCHLSPRNCTLRENQAGFCRVRKNIGGELVTLNYGRTTQLTRERIETEAVYHFAPGAEILSLGNVGCMMSCDYCHNWKTSQAKFVEGKDIRIYTPEQVVDIAEEYGIRILSWTYNDPVVWQEFVLDTAALAKKRGMLNLYKSAFFISELGASELCDVIDIFSISVKSLNPEIYRKVTKGWLEPVLNATKLVYSRRKHVEISNLMVTDSTDGEDDARAIANWVIQELSPSVPLHFVRFHPDYKYTHVDRTPIPRLERAREVALKAGIRHCYLGNVYGHDAANTHCRQCGQLLVERYGLNTWLRGLDPAGNCTACGTSGDFEALPLAQNATESPVGMSVQGVIETIQLNWENDINACHVEIVSSKSNELAAYYVRMEADGRDLGPFQSRVADPGGRFILTRQSTSEVGVKLLRTEGTELRVYRVYDRAHYPTVDIASEDLLSTRLPSPQYKAAQQARAASIVR